MRASLSPEKCCYSELCSLFESPFTANAAYNLFVGAYEDKLYAARAVSEIKFLLFLKTCETLHCVS